MNTPTERELINAAERLLKQQELQIDELTGARLRAARLRALDHAGVQRFGWFNPRAFIGASVAAAFAMLLWISAPMVLPDLNGQDAMIAQMDLATDEDALEFYSDLEFYDWLANEDDAS
jgi:hypothetical protein